MSREILRTMLWRKKALLRISENLKIMCYRECTYVCVCVRESERVNMNIYMGTQASLILQINIYEYLLWSRHKNIFWKLIVNKKNTICLLPKHSQCWLYVSPSSPHTELQWGWLTESICLAPLTPGSRKTLVEVGGTEMLGHPLPTFFLYFWTYCWE